MALTRKTAEPAVVSASSAAASVTFCTVFQFDGVNVLVAEPETVRSASPLTRATETLTFAEGACDSRTPKEAVPSSGTEMVVGLTTSAGPESGETVMPTGAEVVTRPLLSVALAVIE